MNKKDRLTISLNKSTITLVDAFKEIGGLKHRSEAFETLLLTAINDWKKHVTIGRSKVEQIS